MNRAQIIQLIREIAGENNAFEVLEGRLAGLSRENLSEQLLECGIIPEMFAHDSSEEKLWAKYCDILLCGALNALGIHAEVIRARGDSADVFGKTAEYTLVGDAKAFRLSRTARNQKDFKVAALDDWRRENTFACLVSPLYQYPGSRSQIYAQAIARNVTLLSYIHLKFLVDHSPGPSLKSLWEAGRELQPLPEAEIYWTQVDRIVLHLTGQSADRLRAYKQAEIEQTQVLGREGIEYWQTVIRNYASLSQQEAVSRLIRSEKIEEKIRTIQQAMSRERPV